MPVILRDYQIRNRDDIRTAWNQGARFVLSVLPTGAGKTVIFSHILAQQPGVSVAIAHRRELLGQMSEALAENETPHAVIGPDKASREFSRRHLERFGRSYIDPNARCFVASVDTVMARQDRLREWGQQVRLWVQDEAHHVLEDNKWGKVAALFPNARGLGVTATPIRGDSRSLQAGRGGLFERLVQGPGQRELIDAGHLTNYRIWTPPQGIDLTGIRVTNSGDFSKPALATAAHASHIVGDVVEQYLKIARGEQGVTFVTDVKTAHHLADQFNALGVPAVALSAQSPDGERFDALQRFRRRELLQLVNVDLFGEGFDLPAIQVVSFARPTASYGLYAQQFGRVLRPYNGKTHGKIIDHVGNVQRHGLPDRHIVWSLDDGRAPGEDITTPPLRTCLQCLRLWEGYSRECPHCGFRPEITQRSAPEQVEGDLTELDPATLDRLRGAADSIDRPVSEAIAPLQYAGAPQAAIAGLAANHRKRQAAQAELRRSLSDWGGAARGSGLSDSERFIKFYREFGVDVLSAQALGRPEAEGLRERVERSMGQF